MGVEFTFEEPPPPKMKRESPLASLRATLDANPGRWIKVPGQAGSKHWATHHGYECTTRGKDLYIRKPPRSAPSLTTRAPVATVAESERDATIRRLRREGVSTADIAKRFGITSGRVSQIAPNVAPARPGMRVVGMPSIADEMDRAGMRR